MAQLKEIVETENNRSENGAWSTIYLFLEKNSNMFWRAFEWSAWLV